MKDLEKMRAKFEEEVRLAKLGNRFESEYGIEPTVFRSGGYDFIHVTCVNGLAARILSEIEPDTEMVLNDSTLETIKGYYELRSERRYSDKASTLEIEFIKGEVKYWLSLQIDYNELLEPFFRSATRQIVDTELSTYHPTDSRGLLNRDLRIPSKRFNSPNVINYYGGSQKLVDPEEARIIVETIKEELR